MTAQEGMACLGSMITTRLLASASGSVEFQPGDEESSGRWDLCEWRFVRNVGDAMWIEAGTGEGRRGIDLGRTLKRMEAAEDREEERVLFAAEIRTEPPPGPESPIARLWHECLGSRPIPFNRRARRALIVDGCKHPELKRHIEAWQEMKRTRSKWMGRSEDEWRSGSGLLD
jgi:hypothetical protein